jgi:hypothetical protein
MLFATNRRRLNGGAEVPTLSAAIVAAGFSLAAVLYVPALLRPGISVSRFPQLPAWVAIDLKSRGCNIVRGKNVVSADLAGSGQPDWAVLCQQGNRASLLIYLAGSHTPSIFNETGAGLTEEPESARAIRVVGWDYVARHNPGTAPVDAPARACIEDGVGMGSSIYCHLNGAWVALTGAD